MNYQDKKKPYNLDSMPSNPSRRSLIMMCASLFAASYVYRGSSNSGSNNSIELTKRTAILADLARVTVDSTHMVIDANGPKGIKIS